MRFRIHWRYHSVTPDPNGTHAARSGPRFKLLISRGLIDCAAMLRDAKRKNVEETCHKSALSDVVEVWTRHAKQLSR